MSRKRLDESHILVWCVIIDVLSSKCAAICVCCQASAAAEFNPNPKWWVDPWQLPQKMKKCHAPMAAGRCGRISLTIRRTSPDSSLFINAIASCWSKWKNCIQACNCAIWRGEEIEKCSNLWVLIPCDLRDCGARRMRDAGWEQAEIHGHVLL